MPKTLGRQYNVLFRTVGATGLDKFDSKSSRHGIFNKSSHEVRTACLGRWVSSQNKPFAGIASFWGQVFRISMPTPCQECLIKSQWQSTLDVREVDLSSDHPAKRSVYSPVNFPLLLYLILKYIFIYKNIYELILRKR